MYSGEIDKIFKEFACTDAYADNTYEYDVIGARLRHDLYAVAANNFRVEKFQKVDIARYLINEEYFEWIDILEAVANARNQFVMLEIGAGLGRWAARAGLAARKRQLPCYLGLIEAEPAHSSWIKMHMQDNNFKKTDYTVFPVALGETNGETLFYVAKPAGFEGNSPHEWYGQALVKDYEKLKNQTEKKSLLKRMFQRNKNKYYGHELIELESGWKAVRVKQTKLSEIIKSVPFEIIDLCDFDIQGVETIIIKEAIDFLDRRVNCMHICTHSREIEKELLELLPSHNWRLTRNYACCQDNETEFGKINFVDGVQTWHNMRFM